MGDLPRWKNVKNGLIMMGDLPKWKMEKIWSGLIVMGDLPGRRKNVKLSHCYGWPTQMKDDGLIMMGDLPEWKMMVSLWWVTYPDGKMWLTWQKDVAGEVLTG
jgi:hypothetical protein